jgi:hypothetical protein
MTGFITVEPAFIDGRVVIEATRAFSPGVSFVSPSEYRYMIDYPGDLSNVYEFSQQWVAHFGTCAVGQKIFVRTYVAYTTGAGAGLRGTPVESSCIVS